MHRNGMFFFYICFNICPQGVAYPCPGVINMDMTITLKQFKKKKVQVGTMKTYSKPKEQLLSQ